MRKDAIHLGHLWLLSVVFTWSISKYRTIVFQALVQRCSILVHVHPGLTTHFGVFSNLRYLKFMLKSYRGSEHLCSNLLRPLCTSAHRCRVLPVEDRASSSVLARDCETNKRIRQTTATPNSRLMKYRKHVDLPAYLVLTARKVSSAKLRAEKYAPSPGHGGRTGSEESSPGQRADSSEPAHLQIRRLGLARAIICPTRLYHRLFRFCGEVDPEL